MINTLKKMPQRVATNLLLFCLIIGFSGYHISQVQAASELPTLSTSLCNITRDLKMGMVGNDVKELQKYLNINGFPVAQTGAGSKDRETTFFGTLTKNALAKLQKDNKIPATMGVFDSATRAFFVCVKPDVILPVIPFNFTRDLKLGMVGNDVKELQKYLNNNGFPVTQTGVGSKGRETTFFGALTRDALARFQIAKLQTILDSTKLKAESGNLLVDTRNFINGHQPSGVVPTVSYLLTYTAGAGGTISGAASQTVKTGGNGLSVRATPKSGYYFTKWSDGVTKNPRTDINVTANKSITANFAYRYHGGGGGSPSVATYTLTYTAGTGGTISGTASQTVNSGSSGSAVTAVPSANYVFVSWSDASTANPRTDTDVTANKSVTASFIIDTYTVTFDANGSTGGIVPANQAKTHDVTLVLTTNSGSLVKTGYTFSGWNTSADGSGTDYAVGANYTANAGVTLFAKWTIAAPTSLSYNPSNLFVINQAISTLSPTVTGVVESYSISPDLPAGLSLNTSNGQITGTPTVSTDSTTYTITATNAVGSTTFNTLVIMVDSTVTGADGRVWLDRNLGATRVATSFDDYQSYGSLFQWGRASDGHQFINHTTEIAATAVNGNTSTLATSDTPGDNLFIINSSSPFDWRNSQNNNLWQGVNGTNNVCPAGFRLPTRAEWSTLVSSEGITNYTTAYSSSLKLTAAGYRSNINASLSNLGALGYYWSSSLFGNAAYELYFHSDGVDSANNVFRAFGLSVRCIQEVATIPSSIALAVGSSTPVGGVTNVAIPAAGATDTTGAVTGWTTSTADKIKFTVVNGGSATSTITIGGAAYTSGADYTIPSASPLTIIVTTTETGRTTVSRTFTVSVAASPTVGMDYQGGKIAYIFQAGDPGYVAGETHGIIAATTDQGSGIVWAKLANQSSSVPGGTLATIGSGSSNTDNIIAQNGLDSTYAAGIARSYTGGGYNDWYLPSLDELTKVHVNQIIVGNFSADYYWSSTEGAANLAWSKYFFLGSSISSQLKSTPWTYVRAVRSF